MASIRCPANAIHKEISPHKPDCGCAGMSAQPRRNGAIARKNAGDL